MKMKNKLVLFSVLSALAAFSSNAVFAGEHEVGNGGYGYEGDDGVLYSLDLVESGVEKNPYLNTSIAIQPDIKKYVDAAFDGVTGIPVIAIEQKLSEIYQISPVFALETARAFHLYSWGTVNAFFDPKDAETLVEASRLVPIAARMDALIMLRASAFSRLNEVNQAALILHEIWYAMSVPVKGVQSGMRARNLLGYVFTQAMGKNGLEGLKPFLSILLNLNLQAQRSNWNWAYASPDFTDFLSSYTPCEFSLKFKNLESGIYCNPGVNLSEGGGIKEKGDYVALGDSPTSNLIEKYCSNASSRPLTAIWHVIPARVPSLISYLSPRGSKTYVSLPRQNYSDDSRERYFHAPGVGCEALLLKTITAELAGVEQEYSNTTE